MARLREFEPEEALSDMMNIFWGNGFDGTSMADIEAVTGLNKQSLYRVYGDKRGMYLAALSHYEASVVAEALELLVAPGSASTKIRRVFDGLLKAAADGDRRGCFTCNASIDQAQFDAETKNYVGETLALIEEGFRKALASSPPYDKNQNLRKKAAEKLLASYMGLRVLVSAGASLDKLKSIVRQSISEI